MVPEWLVFVNNIQQVSATPRAQMSFNYRMNVLMSQNTALSSPEKYFDRITHYSFRGFAAVDPNWSQNPDFPKQWKADKSSAKPNELNNMCLFYWMTQVKKPKDLKKYLYAAYPKMHSLTRTGN